MISCCDGPWITLALLHACACACRPTAFDAYPLQLAVSRLNMLLQAQDAGWVHAATHTSNHCTPCCPLVRWYGFKLSQALPGRAAQQQLCMLITTRQAQNSHATAVLPVAAIRCGVTLWQLCSSCWRQAQMPTCRMESQAGVFSAAVRNSRHAAQAAAALLHNTSTAFLLLLLLLRAFRTGINGNMLTCTGSGAAQLHCFA